MTPLIKKTLLGSLIALGTLTAVIFAFGSSDPLNRAIARQPQPIRFESLPPAPSSLSQENITREIARQVALEITEQNPDGPQAGPEGQEIIADNPEELAQRALERAFSEIKIEDLRPVIADSELIIIKSSEPESEEAYFNSLRKILVTSFPATLNVNQIDPTKTDFAAFDAAFNKSINEIRAITVPYRLVSYQKDVLSLLTALRNVFVLIKNYKADPFQAAIAVEAGDQFGLELKETFDRINAYIADNNLKLAY